MLRDGTFFNHMTLSKAEMLLVSWMLHGVKVREKLTVVLIEESTKAEWDSRR